jgi:hypothetical protein
MKGLGWLREIVATGEAEANEWCGWCSGPINQGDWCGRDEAGDHVCERCMR